MSEVELQKELTAAKNNIKGLTAQCEAAKQMLNEQLTANLQLRTNMNIFGSTNQELVKEITELKKIKLELENQIVGLAQKINELTEAKSAEIPPVQE